MALVMVNSLHHRGPDDSGTWTDAETGIALGHQRLAIIDLSPEGHQPMHSVCGRYVISFNGEVYNYKALRNELAWLGHKFRGHSDTEVMLTAISQWGILPAVKRFNGMFAFALWDRRERLLHLVRDRLGEKPLYYGWMGKIFLFGSELKALRAHPHCKDELNRDALALYLRHSYIPAPYSIYKGISKVLPGTIVTIKASEVDDSPQITPYWSVREAAERGAAEPFRGSAADAIACLDELLRDAVKIRMEADVPLGAFLSGGIDSSTIVSLMQAQSARPVETFTIGFHEAAYNEANDAKAVARHLGTAHTELYVTPEEAMAVIPRLPALYDEPFSDCSQIPTFLVSDLARRSVTVSLSGDGGDELFGGYTRYFWAQDIWNNIRWISKGLRQMLARTLTAIPPQAWKTALDTISPVLPSRIRQRNPADKFRKFTEILAAEHPEAMYVQLISHWKNPTAVVIGSSEPPTIITDKSRWAGLSDFRLHMMYLDMMTYLPDDILVKVDRASMGVSLEGRIPYLDHRVIEFAWQLPLAMKVHDKQGKWILRQILYQYVPPELVERPKMGFGVPIDSWLRGPLREWADSLLDEKVLLDQGHLDPLPIRQLWAEHLSGRHSREYELWDVLMFQAWLANEQQTSAVVSHQ